MALPDSIIHQTTAWRTTLDFVVDRLLTMRITSLSNLYIGDILNEKTRFETGNRKLDTTGRRFHVRRHREYDKTGFDWRVFQ